MNSASITAIRRTTRCSLCGRSMLKKALRRHLLVHGEGVNGIVYSRFQCNSCHATFARKDILGRHLSEQHSGRYRTVQCSFCGSWVRERAIKGHLNSRNCFSARSWSDSHDAVYAFQSALLGTSAIFEASTLLNPLTPAWSLFIEFGSYPDRQELLDPLQWQQYWSLRGMALRSIIKTLDHVNQSNFVHLSLALFLLGSFAVPQEHSTDSDVLIGTLFTLERQQHDPVFYPRSDLENVAQGISDFMSLIWPGFELDIGAHRLTELELHSSSPEYRLHFFRYCYTYGWFLYKEQTTNSARHLTAEFPTTNGMADRHLEKGSGCAPRLGSDNLSRTERSQGEPRLRWRSFLIASFPQQLSVSAGRFDGYLCK